MRASNVNPDKVYRAAMRLFVGKTAPQDWTRAFKLMKEAAAARNAKAIAALGSFYDYGVGTKKNPRLAFEHYRMAALAGEPDAEYNLALCYVVGRGVRRNNSMAITWLRRAAKNNVPEAMHELGYAYRYKKFGLKKNLREGFKWELASAKAGLRDAQFSVGVSLSRGEGIRADPEQALKWYLKAAKKGHSDAAYNVAKFYETGRGVKTSPSKARQWYARAKAQAAPETSQRTRG